MAASSSVYERQALESCPCPFCGAYALCVDEETECGVAEDQHRPMLVR